MSAKVFYIHARSKTSNIDSSAKIDIPGENEVTIPYVDPGFVDKICEIIQST